MTKIVIAFDVEDYVQEQAADGILYSAQILQKAGVKGCFNIVARLAEALVKWGRQDIIDALQYHEIDLHSLAHSYHPTINEYTDRADYEGALEEFLKQEEEGVRIIDSIFGKKPHPAACPPGNSVSYVAHYGYAKMGCKVYAGDLILDRVSGRPMHYCNLLSTHYNVCLDSFLKENSPREMKEFLDGIAGKHETFVFFHHPAMGIYNNYWDLVNFYGKNTPEEQWKCAERFSDEVIRAFYENFAVLIELIQKDDRFEIVTQQEIADQYYDADRTVTLSMLPSIRDQIREELFPVTAPLSLSLCDIFYACRSFLLGENEHICGDSYGFLGDPFAITKPFTFTAEQFRESAKHVKADGFLPEFVYVDGVKLGPADWMRGAMEILCGAESATVKPDVWQIATYKILGMRNLFVGIRGWVNNTVDYTDQYLSKRGVLQSWTIRFPKNSLRIPLD